MSTELRESRPASSVSPAPKSTAAPVKKESLASIVAQVHRDSQARPAQYLDEVVVPKGGE